jgi:hypothetical protein
MTLFRCTATVAVCRTVTPCALAIFWLVGTAYAGHERFVVGQMQDVAPLTDTVSATSGACIPSHDRETLACYFTFFDVTKALTEAQRKKQNDETEQALKKDSKQFMNQMKSMCSDPKMQPDALQRRVQYNEWAKRFPGAVKAFCDNPSIESALALTRVMADEEAKKCHVVVTDWHGTLTRQVDRWVANVGPTGLCGVIQVFTLVPHDVKKMREPAGPVLWTLHQKTVTTHGADDKFCTTIKESASTYTWDAFPRSLDCGEFDFVSGLERTGDPTGSKSK